jgi:hypothetical protein
VLIPGDSPDASTLMSRAIGEGKPIAIVFPDGSDVVAGGRRLWAKAPDRNNMDSVFADVSVSSGDDDAEDSGVA